MQNRIVVEDFSQRYGQQGTTFKCYYDPLSPTWGAVVKVVMPGLRVLHAMVWPTCALFLGSLICAIFCSRCRRTTLKKESQSSKKKKSGGKKPEEEIELNTKEEQEMPPPSSSGLRQHPSPLPEVAAVSKAARQAKQAKQAQANKAKAKTKGPRPAKPLRKDLKKVAEAATEAEKKNVWL